jgi:polyphosphate kinase
VPGDRYLNRELSWLEFNARVLAIAEDASLPVLERVKFVAIFANLDGSSVRRGAQEQVGRRPETSPTGTPPNNWRIGRSRELAARAAELFTSARAGARRADPGSSARSTGSEADLEFLEQEVRRTSSPVHPNKSTRHPFPYISSLSLNLTRSPATR